MLIPEQIQLASMAVREVRVALSNFFLYSSENAMVKQSLDRLLQVLANLFENLPSISLGESEGRLVVEGAPLDERLTGSTNMIKDLFITQKIHTLTFLKGVESAELETLFSLLKPRALPQGVSLAQALVQHSLSHVKVNEKVFVALSEGEVVMSADSAGPGNEQNLQEALEALQYFLQIFSRVRPDSNKQEVAKRLMDNMGFWLSSEGVLPSSSEGAGGSGETGGVKTGSPNVQPWKELMGGFLGLRNALTAMKTPAEITQTQVSMEDLLKKLVLLGESQGVSLTEEPGKKMPPADSPGPAGPTAHAEVEKPGLAPPEQENLFETDPVLAAINTGDWNTLLKPDLEDQFAQKLPYLQEPERADAFEPLWETLWGKIFSPDEEAQTLALRQVSRMQWSSLPRTLQLEGLRNLRMMLLRTRTPALFMMTLAMAQDWITQELVSPDWTEILETTRLLEELSELSPPNFEGQNNAARAALETIYTGPVLENLHMLYVAGGKEAPALLKLFKELGHRTTSFLLQKIERPRRIAPLG